MKYLTTDGKAYVLDINKVMDFVTSIDSDENYTNTTVTQSYAVDPDEENMSMVAKEITENRLNGNDTYFNLRYDMVKLMVETVVKDEDAGMEDGRVLPFSKKFAINTLLKAGIMSVINETDD